MVLTLIIYSQLASLCYPPQGSPLIGRVQGGSWGPMVSGFGKGSCHTIPWTHKVGTAMGLLFFLKGFGPFFDLLVIPYFYLEAQG